MKTKSTAAILALLLGGFGIHKFYLGQSFQGILYLLFCWTLIPAVLGLLEFFVYLSMSEHMFNMRYNSANMAMFAHAPMQNQMGQNVTVNIPQGPAPNVSEQLHKLNDLRVSGVLTDQEFTQQKQRLLGA